MAYSYKRSITIDYTKCGTANSTDFPVLVSFTDVTFKTVANGGKVQNSNGYDIAFYSDLALTTSLYWELEKYVATTGECVFWVKVPTLSASANTVIYIAYGDASISTFQSTSTSVWDTNFKGVWHWGNGTTLSGVDSIASGHNGTLTNMAAGTGKIDGCASFTASSNSKIDYSAVITPIGAKTISFWVKFSSSNFTLLYANVTNGNTGYGLGCIVGTNVSFEINWANPSSKLVPNIGTAVINDGNWHHIVYTWDGTTGVNKAILYCDGVSVATTTANSTESNTPTQNLHLGYYDNANDFTGLMDELKVSNVARSSSWVLSEYNNQNSPSTFFTLGAETLTSSSNLFMFF